MCIYKSLCDSLFRSYALPYLISRRLEYSPYCIHWCLSRSVSGGVIHNEANVILEVCVSVGVHEVTRGIHLQG